MIMSDSLKAPYAIYIKKEARSTLLSETQIEHGIILSASGQQAISVVDVALYKCLPRHLVNLRVVVFPKFVSNGEKLAHIGENRVRVD